MNSNSPTAADLKLQLADHYFDINELASNHLLKDADGNDLFLVLVRVTSKDPDTTAIPSPAIPSSPAESRPGEESPTPEFDANLFAAIHKAKVRGEICDKQHCAGGVNPFRGKSKRKHQVPRNIALAAAPADGASSSDFQDIQKELEVITHVARIVYSSIYLDPTDDLPASGGDAV